MVTVNETGTILNCPIINVGRRSRTPAGSPDPAGQLEAEQRNASRLTPDSGPAVDAETRL
jgi:hypothetical protein